MKYIDANRLRAEIEKRKQIHFDDYFIKKSGNPADYGASNALAQVLSLITSLQQEQTELSDYKRGYIAGKRYYERGPIDMKVHLGNVSDEITQEVINWFVNYAPEWGVTLQNNRWQYHLANHFYNLGVAHEREALLNLKEKEYDRTTNYPNLQR